MKQEWFREPENSGKQDQGMVIAKAKSKHGVQGGTVRMEETNTNVGVFNKEKFMVRWVMQGLLMGNGLAARAGRGPRSHFVSNSH